jgi:16S rRNA processing protein RimM
MGRASGAFGQKGEIRVYPFSSDPRIFAQAAKFFAGPNPEGAQAYTLVSLRIHGKRLLLKAQEVKTRGDAEKFKGAWIYLERRLLPEPEKDEYYWFQVLGAAVFTPGGRRLGKVQQVTEAGAHDLWVVRDEKGREAILPVIADVIVEMDLAGQRIVVDPPEGLLEAQGFEEN